MKEFFNTLEFLPFSAFCIVLVAIACCVHFFGILTDTLLAGYVTLIVIFYLIGLFFILRRKYREFRDSEILDEENYIEDK